MRNFRQVDSPPQFDPHVTFDTEFAPQASECMVAAMESCEWCLGKGASIESVTVRVVAISDEESATLVTVTGEQCSASFLFGEEGADILVWVSLRET